MFFLHVADSESHASAIVDLKDVATHPFSSYPVSETLVFPSIGLCFGKILSIARSAYRINSANHQLSLTAYHEHKGVLLTKHFSFLQSQVLPKRLLSHDG